ncbi:hypothetical protein IEQ34_006940 [Dendrobium chrysotoxum]|uniref:Uncharacterized protein n=1 Tax=Dendrobium chrysotoxum TaxID=161865 RepID=A0AAV7H7V2_DENCH|nr:hypothetical protein IEQ34_006940 [Dendrobium chrysotoxum]
MASMCRSAALAAVRASSLRSQILLPKSSPSRLASPVFCRSLASALGTVDSLRPLHNAVASARLISNIAVDSSCWSWPSQGTVAMVCWSIFGIKLGFSYLFLSFLICTVAGDEKRSLGIKVQSWLNIPDSSHT